MGLDFLKEGLSPQDKAKITRTFNKQVNEEVEIRVAALVETHINDMINSLNAKFDRAMKNAYAAINKMVVTEAKVLDKSVSKYITYFVAESLPKELVEKAGAGLRYGKFLDSILETQKAELREQVEKELSAKVKGLEETLNQAQSKYKKLFERMVNDANDKVIDSKKMKVDEMLKEYPDKYANTMRKIIKETMDFATIETKDLKPKIERIFEAVKKTEKKNDVQRLNENTNRSAPVRSRGQSQVPIIESAPSDPDVAFALDILESTTFGR